MMLGLEVLTTEEMQRADKLSSLMGISSLTLMENAGLSVAMEAEKMLPKAGQVVVLCGPGNNGGDGFVAARKLKEKNYTVIVQLLSSISALKGDAKIMSSLWDGPIGTMYPEAISNADLIIDGLFGAGLKKKIEGVAADIICAINASNVPVLSIDVPSGLDGTTGRSEGPVVEATHTITFFRRKVGHLLFPGRKLSGKVVVADIGIPAAILQKSKIHQNLDSELNIFTFVNNSQLWREHYPIPQIEDHKYSRGHVLVVSGGTGHTGAARLGAISALRIGAGLVTVASPSSAILENASHLTSIMLIECEDAHSLEKILQDKRKNTVLIGPGTGVLLQTAEMVLRALNSGAHVVLDADALTVFSSKRMGTQQGEHFGLSQSLEETFLVPEHLFDQIAKREDRSVVLTPHEGEFLNLFGSCKGSKLDRAREAASRSGAIIVLKGPDTIIAAPDGRAAINENAPAWLATAGSGDVLSGLVAGLLGQKMPPFEAACAAVWIHGECATQHGIGLISEDIPLLVPHIVRKLLIGEVEPLT